MLKRKVNPKKKTSNKLRKKVSKRNKVKNVALRPEYAPKVRRELLDADYLQKLSPEELAWYNQFIDEYVGASVKKNKNGSVKKGHLHNTKALAKDCYDRNNLRNNDVLGVSKANGLLHDIYNQEDGWYITQTGLQEDALIAEIDLVKSSNDTDDDTTNGK